MIQKLKDKTVLLVLALIGAIVYIFANKSKTRRKLARLQTKTQLKEAKNEIKRTDAKRRAAIANLNAIRRARRKK